MYLKIMIIVATATLGVALFATSNASYRVLMEFLVFASAALIVLHALRGRTEYFWAGTFCAIAVLFNPVFPFALPSRVFILLDLICMALFFVYYNAYQTKPPLAMSSVTDRTPGAR